MAFCTRCGRDNDGDARFCAGCGTPLARVARREERKVVTVVFVDVVGSTARAARLDPEDVRAMLAPFQERTRRELERHGGTVEKYIGDAVFAVFGAPTAHEDDPERAVRAGLAVLESVAQLNEEDPALALEVRVGVNTGEALVSLGARPEHGETMVSGDVINTGARLQAAAPVGAVLVGEQTYHATERVIEYREALPIDAKGKDEPVVAWVAVAPHARFGVDLSGPGRAPLVGRTEELGALRAALQRVRTAQAPHLVTLVGVPGIGKTRLVHELLGIVDDDEELIVWRQGRSLSYGGGVSYWALGEMVKAQAGILESDSADEAAAKLERATLDLLDDDAERAWVERHLRPLVGLAGGERDESADESTAAWQRFFEVLAEQNVTILVFDDLHWADDGLLDFVDRLVDEVAGVPLLVVCTARPELLERRPGWGGGKRNAQTVSLSPLTDDETGVLLTSLLEGDAVSGAGLVTLVESSGGVPLFAEEYARMVETGAASPASDIPVTLLGIVGARLDALPADEKRLVHAASVLGKVFWTDALAVLVGADDLDAALRSVARKEFVRRERRSAVAGATQHAFLHALVRDAAYAQIPRAERARLHRLAAEWIESLGRAARTTAPRCSRTISCRRSSSDGPPASTSRIFSHERSTLSGVRASARGDWRHHGRPRASTGVRSTSWATRSPTRSCSSTSAGRWRSRVRPPTGSRPSSAPTGDCSRGMTPKARPLRSCSSTRRAGSPARVSTWRCWNRRRHWSRTPPTAFRGFASWDPWHASSLSRGARPRRTGCRAMRSRRSRESAIASSKGGCSTPAASPD